MQRSAYQAEVMLCNVGDGDGGQPEGPSPGSDEAGGQLAGILAGSC